MSADSSTGFIFNRKKMKYAMMAELFEEELQRRASFTMIIDIWDLLDIFAIDYYKNMVPAYTKNSKAVYAEFLNHLAHYRRFFTEKHGCPVKFIIVGSKRPINMDVAEFFKAETDHHFDTKWQLINFIPFVLKKMKDILCFVPDVLVLDGERNDQIFPLEVLASTGSKWLNSDVTIICSKSVNAFQVAERINNPFVIRTKSDNGVRYYRRNSFFECLFEKEQYTKKKPDEDQISSIFIPTFLAIYPEFGIPSICDVKQRKSISFIQHLAHTLGYTEVPSADVVAAEFTKFFKVENYPDLQEMFATRTVLFDSSELFRHSSASESLQIENLEDIYSTPSRAALQAVVDMLPIGVDVPSLFLVR